MIPINILDITSFTTVQANLSQLIIGALLLSGAIVAVWYFAGVLLQNNGVKASARSEFYQLIGTVIMVLVIVGALSTFSAAFYGAVSSTQLLNPSAVTNLCLNIATTSQLQLLYEGQGSLLTQSLSGQQQNNAQYGGICNLVNLGQQGQSQSQNSGILPFETQTQQQLTLTQLLDYPLASTGVILANLTNQTATNLNDSFVVDSFLGFLQTLKPTTTVCVGLPPPSIQCLEPSAIPPPPPRLFELDLGFSPYKGYQLLTDNMNNISVILTTALETFVAQLVFVSIFLFMWPYMFFIGIVLRSNFLTRKLGGLLMAVAVGMVLFFPAVYSIEYLSLGNGLPSSYNNVFGFNAITTLPANTIPSSTQDYTINFFVQPSIKDIAMHNLCWPELINPANNDPYSIGLVYAEFLDVGYLLIPFTSIISTITAFSGAVPASIPVLSFPASCQPSAALNTFYNILNAYGTVGITAFWLPILNLFITLTAILGLSGLLGGDTTLGGLERLI